MAYIFLFFVGGKALIEFLLRPVQSVGGGLDAVVGILYSQTDDVQKLTLIEGAAVLRGLASAIGNGETLACQIQPGVAIDQFIVLISCLAGGDASEQRGCGGYGFAAQPLDEIKSSLRVLATLGDAKGCTAQNGVLTGYQCTADQFADVGTLTDQIGCIVTV